MASLPRQTTCDNIIGHTIYPFGGNSCGKTAEIIDEIPVHGGIMLVIIASYTLGHGVAWAVVNNIVTHYIAGAGA